MSARLTITLSDDRHRALRALAARRGVTIRQIIEESLDHFGVKPADDAAEIVARARAACGMTEKAATVLAIEECRAQRTA